MTTTRDAPRTERRGRTGALLLAGFGGVVRGVSGFVCPFLLSRALRRVLRWCAPWRFCCAPWRFCCSLLRRPCAAACVLVACFRCWCLRPLALVVSTQPSPSSDRHPQLLAGLVAAARAVIMVSSCRCSTAQIARRSVLCAVECFRAVNARCPIRALGWKLQRTAMILQLFSTAILRLLSLPLPGARRAFGLYSCVRFTSTAGVLECAAKDRDVLADLADHHHAGGHGLLGARVADRAHLLLAAVHRRHHVPQ
jgi:hypothetical protein